MAGRAGAILTLSYLGAVRSLPNYNVMGLAKASLEANVRFLAADLGPRGIRVNAISAGPVKTLSAAGIAGFRKMLARVAQAAPLRRNVTLEDVGNAAAFLCSDLAAGITGEITYVDAGFNTVGMSFPRMTRRTERDGLSARLLLVEHLDVLLHLRVLARLIHVGARIVLAVLRARSRVCCCSCCWSAGCASTRTARTPSTRAPPSGCDSAWYTAWCSAGFGALKAASRIGAGTEGSWRPTKRAASAVTPRSLATASKSLPACRLLGGRLSRRQGGLTAGLLAHHGDDLIMNRGQRLRRRQRMRQVLDQHQPIIPQHDRTADAVLAQ